MWILIEFSSAEEPMETKYFFNVIQFLHCESYVEYSEWMINKIT